MLRITEIAKIYHYNIEHLLYKLLLMGKVESELNLALLASGIPCSLHGIT